MKLVNIGCGRSVHPSWCNLDLTACAPGVVEHDLRTGLPFEPDSCDAVYHSHVLEHLTREDGRRLLTECFRVLKPGGVVRIVVPDLERIAQDYLKSLREAEADSDALVKVEWMKIEMLDQLVRTRSGGEMVRFVHGEGKTHEPFIRSRIGDEVFGDGMSGRKRRTWRDRLRRLMRSLGKARRLLALAAVTTLLGRRGFDALKEGLFRQSGELHRWMYDRVTLKSAVEAIGFCDVKVFTANSSNIAGFGDFQLDSVDGKTRKPDSLFLEALKPRLASNRRIAA
jgi:SAM-dependent methyltransferase